MMRQLRQSKKKALGKEVDNIVFQIKNSYKPEKLFYSALMPMAAKKKIAMLILWLLKIQMSAHTENDEDGHDYQIPLGADILVYTPREWNKALKDGDFCKEIADNGKVIYGQ